MIKATLPPEQGALVLKALEAAVDSLKSDDQFDPWQGVKENGNDAECHIDEASVNRKCVKDVPRKLRHLKRKPLKLQSAKWHDG